MKKTRFSLAVISVVILLSSCNNNYKTLKKPEFPQPAYEMDISNADLETQLTNVTIEQKLPIYRVSNKKMSQTKVEKLLSVFGFVKPTIETRVDTSNREQTIYRENSKELRIVDNGNYVYLNHHNNEDLAITLSDTEVKREAENFLRNNDLLPEGFFVGGVGYSEAYSNMNPEPIIYEKTVGFFHKIYGYDVYGHSDITVTYSENGISAVYSVFNEFVFDRFLECKTIKEAQDKILSSDSWITFDGETIEHAERIKITDFKIVYYDNASSSADFIQPCICFNGSIFDGKGKATTFSSTVPVLKEENYEQ